MLKAIAEDVGKPVVFEKYVKNTRVDQKDVLNIISSLVKCGDELVLEAAARVYVDGKHDSHSRKKVFNTRPWEYDTVEEWYKDALGGKDFLLIINRCERFDEGLVEALMDDVCLPVSRQNNAVSFECVTFIGDYKYTPFGIHIDDGDDLDGTVLHYHLGPAPKDLFLWLESEVPDIKEFDYPNDALKARGETFTLEPNDGFLLPGSKYYHIGYTHGFSVGVTLVIEWVNSKSLIRRAITQYASDLEHALVQQLQKIEKAGLSFDDFFPRKEYDFSMNQWIQSAFHDLAQKKKSAGGFVVPTLERNPQTWNKSDRLYRKKRFPILLQESGDKIVIYTRFRKFSIVNNPAVRVLLDHLVEQDDILLAELYQQYETGISKEAIDYIVNLFMTYRTYGTRPN